MISNKISKPWFVQWRTSVSGRVALARGGFRTEKTYCRGGYTEIWAPNKAQAKSRFRRDFRTEPREKIEILGVQGQTIKIYND